MTKVNREILKRLIEIRAKTRDRDIRKKVSLFQLVNKLGSITEACEQRGYSRSFYYKWWRRFKKSNFDHNSLIELSRKPLTNPKKTKISIEKKIKKLSDKGNGCRMIQAYLARENIKLSVSTIAHINNARKKVIYSRRKRRKIHTRRYELPIPGQRMQMDVKYVPNFVNGKRIYCYVLIDECTRLRFVRAYEEINPINTKDFIEKAKSKFPFPINCIQTDNGQEFTFKHLSEIAEHPLDQWCNSHFIKHQLIPVGVKELNGKVERSHRIDDQYFYWKAPIDNIFNFNIELCKWVKYYNNIRPHGSLKYLTPREKFYERLLNLENEVVDVKLQFLKDKFLKFSFKMLNGKQKQGFKKLQCKQNKLAA